jgi:hypothetical protein
MDVLLSGVVAGSAIHSGTSETPPCVSSSCASSKDTSSTTLTVVPLVRLGGLASQPQVSDLPLTLPLVSAVISCPHDNPATTGSNSLALLAASADRTVGTWPVCVGG